MKVHNVFLAVPGGSDGGLSIGTHEAIARTNASLHHVYAECQASSALTFNFNGLWCQALNRRTALNLDRFLMIHTDIQPLGTDWLDRMLALMDETRADVLSVVSPIKDTNGLTSTALDTAAWTPRRLTLREVHALPETFDGAFVREKYGANLLINTGLMLVRLTEPWAQDVCFTIDNRVARIDGQFVPFFEPEDWKFSRWCHARGLKVVATRAIQLRHLGSAMYDNVHAWGTMPVDAMNLVNGARAQAGQIPG